jgi:transcription antitermination factor NusA-like protein
MDFHDDTNIMDIKNETFELGKQIGCLMQKVREKYK